MIVCMTKQLLTLLEREARQRYPVEACALLFGKLDDEKAVVKRVVVTQNVLSSTVRFEIDSKAFYEAFTIAMKDGLDFVGFFHSHPAAAEPSAVDLQFMRLWGDAVWLIFSSTNKDFGAFQMKNSRVHALKLQAEEKLKE